MNEPTNAEFEHSRGIPMTPENAEAIRKQMEAAELLNAKERVESTQGRAFTPPYPDESLAKETGKLVRPETASKPAEGHHVEAGIVLPDEIPEDKKARAMEQLINSKSDNFDQLTKDMARLQGHDIESE